MVSYALTIQSDSSLRDLLAKKDMHFHTGDYLIIGWKPSVSSEESL